MRTTTTIATSIAVLILLARAGNAALITIDPEDAGGYGTVIDTAFNAQGVTLSAADSFGNALPWNIISIDPTLNSPPFSPTTGDYVFGLDDGGYRHEWYESYSFLRVDFASSVNSVWIDAIANDGDSAESAILSAYDSSGTLLDSDAISFGSGVNGNSWEQLSVNSGSGDISYVLASGTGGNTVGLDHLVFENDAAGVPDGGATLALLGCGLLGVAAAARRCQPDDLKPC